MWRIVHDLKRLDACDSALNDAFITIEKKNLALIKADQTIAALDSAYHSKEKEANELVDLMAIERDLYNIEYKKAFKKGGILGSGITAFIFLLILL